MFSIGGVTGVKGDASSPPGDSCARTKDADKIRQEEDEDKETSECPGGVTVTIGGGQNICEVVTE